MRTGTVRLGTGVALLCACVLARAADRRVYRIVPAESTLGLHVGKEGLLKGFGHEHEVVARKLRGQVELAAGDLRGSHVSVTVDSASLEVDARLEPSGDAPKVQETMLGPKVLDAAAHPSIRFESTALVVKPRGAGVYDVQLTGDLTLRGTTRSITIPTRVELMGAELRARGSTTIRQSDFGIEPIRAAAGSVRVKNEVELRFTLVARLVP
jgi:polyisoprenoid-binding protein YceI